MECRKHRVCEPVDSLIALAKQPAAAVLAGHSLRDTTRKHGVLKQQVYYYVKKRLTPTWATCSVSAPPAMAAPALAALPRKMLGEIKGHDARHRRCRFAAIFRRNTTPGRRVFERKKFVLKLAATLVQDHAFSIHKAAHIHKQSCAYFECSFLF